MFPDQQSREQAIVEHARNVKGWDFVLGVVMCAGVGIASLILARLMAGGIAYLMVKFTPWSLPGGLREILMFALVIPCMYFTIRGLHRWGVRRDLRHKLLNLGVPVCLSCGYLLRGLSGAAAKCPECGAVIDSRARAALAAEANRAAISHAE